jgi:hypothetical protein
MGCLFKKKKKPEENKTPELENKEQAKKNELEKIPYVKEDSKIGEKEDLDEDNKNDITSIQSKRNQNFSKTDGDKSSRKLLPDDEKKYSYHKALQMFKDKVKEVNIEEIGIKEEIEMMKKDKVYKNVFNDDKSNIIRMDTNTSNVSKISAHNIAKKTSVNQIIQYTNEHRSEPGDSFYDMKMEDIQNERKEQEKDELDAKTREKLLEETLKRKMEDRRQDAISYHTLEDAGANNKEKGKLEVKSHQMMTDYSNFAKNAKIELYKDTNTPFVKVAP